MWPQKKKIRDWLTISDLLLNNAFASVRLLRVFLPDDIKSSSRSSCIMYYLRREGARWSGCEENASPLLLRAGVHLYDNLVTLSVVEIINDNSSVLHFYGIPLKPSGRFRSDAHVCTYLSGSCF